MGIDERSVTDLGHRELSERLDVELILSFDLGRFERQRLEMGE